MTEERAALREDHPGPQEILRRTLAGDTRRVVVLDDDPTGTQAAHGLDMLLGDVEAGLERFAATGDRAVYVLTNTRAMAATEAVALVTELADLAGSALGQDAPRLVLRGDSTLRGHVAAEMGALGLDRGVGLFVPAYPSGGRSTVEGVHRLRRDGRDLPVGETEYAGDPVFGYRESRLDRWAAEVGLRGGVRLVGLARVRGDDTGTAVAEALTAVRPGEVVVPDAETDDDIARICLGLLTAERSGRHIVVRSASSLAAARAGTGERAVPPERVAGHDRVLVVCGSHTEGASRQLDALGLPVRLLPVGELLDRSGDADDPVWPELEDALRRDLDTAGVAVLATERVRQSAHGQLHHGHLVMQALVGTAGRVAPACDAVVAKGGITSASIARQALAADTAHVEGQLLPGIPLWTLRGGAHRRLPYVVVPGNVGDDTTLLRVLEALRRPATTA